MIVLGLTGSIGMGKSTTARLFAEAGARIWDADAAVHRLYGKGGAALPDIGALVPEAVTSEGVNRDRLREAIISDASLLTRLESIVHPLVGEDRRRFIDDCAADGVGLVVCDIPLLFETDGARCFDAVVVVSAPESVQRDRVLAREGMTEEALNKILERQMPDVEKRARADFVVDTSGGFDAARRQVKAIIESVEETGDA